MENEIIQTFALNNNKECHAEFINEAYDTWERWNTTLFDDYFENHDWPVILLEELIGLDNTQPKTDLSLGFCARLPDPIKEALIQSGFIAADGGVYDGFPPQYVLCENTFMGSNNLLAEGKDHYENRVLYMLDVILHEMVHHYVMLEFGPDDSQQSERERRHDDHLVFPGQPWYEARREHSKIYSKVCNRVGRKLGLLPVAYFFRQEDHNRHPERSCICFPHGLRQAALYRTGNYYDGAIKDHRAWSRTI